MATKLLNLNCKKKISYALKQSFVKILFSQSTATLCVHAYYIASYNPIAMTSKHMIKFLDLTWLYFSKLNRMVNANQLAI